MANNERELPGGHRPIRYPRPLPSELERKRMEILDTAQSLETQSPNLGPSEETLFADMMRSDTKISWLLNWERVEENLYDKGTEQKRAEVCQGCGENRPTSNKAASLGIDIMGTSLCQKCSNEGYLARF